ncbi:MAG TPA: preprotein translocase subunit SecE [Patescibacteria group bacterium]|nr:preprotein translocase subunit SecE [Patescibacteria group bacterium]
MASKKGIGTAFIGYLRNAKEELRKVSWPTRNDLIKNTLGVIVVSLAIAVFLGGLDYAFNQGLLFILNK